MRKAYTVGVDRVIERAGVAKATLYTLFGNKDGLVRAYLEVRDEAIRERMTRQLGDQYKTPRERLLGVFDVQSRTFSDPGFRGRAFARASAEAPEGTSIEDVSEAHCRSGFARCQTDWTQCWALARVGSQQAKRNWSHSRVCS